MSLALAALLLTAGIVGCNKPSPSPVSSAPLNRGPSLEPTRDSFVLAMDFLERIEEFEPEQARGQIAYHLNRWIENQPPDDQWLADPLVGRLPQDIRSITPLQELAQLRFRSDDVHFLQEVSWLRDISDWVSRRPSGTGSSGLFGELESSLSPAEAEQLLIAERLFDWTVRNIQLEQLLAYPKQPIAGPQTEPGVQARPLAPPPARGVPGPGYTRYPRHVLMQGRGDAWQRAQVFIQLARQQDLDVVMLAIDNPRQSVRPRPWLPAVLIGNQLFLFDSQLGLAIPGPGGDGIATLEHVLEDPGLLEALQLEAQSPYRISPADLEHLVALLDAPSGYLSQRMRLLERRLTAEQHRVLSMSPSGLAKRVREANGVTQVALWTLPYEAYWYRTARERLVRQDADAFREYVEQEGIFQGLHPLVRGRQQHFRGVFENSQDEQGAKSWYLSARTPDALLQRLDTDLQVQKSLGLLPSDQESPAVRQARLQQSKLFFTQAKMHASYWLALAHYETGKYDVAADWFERRTLQTVPESPWKQGARYNLARCYEALGQWEKARELYLAGDDSPQREGNRLRAHLLDKQPTAP